MSRGIPTALDDAVNDPVVRPFLAVRLELPDPVYVFTGRGQLIFNDADGNSRTWLGAGGLGSIDTIGEATDGSATGIKVTLFEVPTDFRDDVAQQATRGALFEIYVGALDQAMQVVTATYLIWKGRIDQYKITDNGTTLSVEVSGESRAIDQQRPAIKRFTDEYQQRMHPGDRFFEYVPQMTEVSILWAQAEGGSAAVPVGAPVTGRGPRGGSVNAM